jgi:hypothetical protein
MKINIFILASVFSFMVTSCTNEGMDFDTNGGKGLEFVHFVGNSQSLVTKSDTENTLEITVSASSLSDVDRTYNLTISPNTTAIEGEQFSLSSKTVTIPSGKYSASVILTANNDNLTPEEVVVYLEINSEDAIDYGKTAKITLSAFFEVTMNWLVGTWHWTDSDGYEFDVEIAKVDDNTISIYNIWEFEETVTASVNYEEGFIAIEPNAHIGDYPPYGPVTICPVIGGSYSKTESIIGTCRFSGIQLAQWGAYLFESGYNFGEDYTSVLTKK